MISDKLKPFGTTIFSEMTALAQQQGAINLSQGFSDFEGPSEVLDAAVTALRSGDNQYARSMGHPRLVEAIARQQARHYGLKLDPLTEVAVFSGATEGIASSLLGLLNPGDEVILFEPFYDSYPACVALAGATPRYCTLKYPRFALDEDDLASLFTDRTRLLLLNTPHNPTGKVFNEEELSVIARLCKKHDVIVLTDEVYEHLVFEGARHMPMATLPGMRERTLSLSSAGKTFSFTGWKVGWATGPTNLVAAGLRPAPPQGTYFVLADFTSIHEGDDRAFVRSLIEEKGVAAIPPSVFYKAHLEEGQKLVRFAFCKRMETLEAAAERLRTVTSS